MVSRKITIDISVRCIPKSEKTKETDKNQKKNKNWFAPSWTKQKDLSKQ